MKNRKYYIRIKQPVRCNFEAYLEEQGISYSHLTNDFGVAGASSLYYVTTSSEVVLELNLKFETLGCVDIDRTLLTSRNIIYRCDNGPVMLKY